MCHVGLAFFAASSGAPQGRRYNRSPLIRRLLLGLQMSEKLLYFLHGGAMERKTIPVDELHLNLFNSEFRRGALLVVGDQQRSNLMTVSWGFTGTMWNKPVWMAVVRPTRYTSSLLKTNKSFAMNFLSSQYREQLALCGTRSGLYLDKWAACRFNKISGRTIPTPSIECASLIIECRVLHEQKFEAAGFMLPEITTFYPQKDYHNMYFGEILHVEGVDSFHAE
jgi:flavin reductase (DIM6/NTAB) family NADH-FMN oxidoreductase RutF